MVRLKASWVISSCTALLYFNSTMVRLKEKQNGYDVIAGKKFQFHYGAIKRTGAEH